MAVVVYSNQSKTDCWKVLALMIRSWRRSEPVAEAMAPRNDSHRRRRVAVAVDGSGRPTGGTPEKPVGWSRLLPAWMRGGTGAHRVRTFNFIGGREMVRFSVRAGRARHGQAVVDGVRSRGESARLRPERCAARETDGGRRAREHQDVVGKRLFMAVDIDVSTRDQIGRHIDGLRDAIGTQRLRGCAGSEIT